jgi:Mg2+ and Co2+ transporter CorA
MNGGDSREPLTAAEYDSDNNPFAGQSADISQTPVEEIVIDIDDSIDGPTASAAQSIPLIENSRRRRRPPIAPQTQQTPEPPPPPSLDAEFTEIDDDEDELLTAAAVAAATAAAPTVEIHSFHREDASNELARTMIPLIVKFDRDIMDAVNRTHLELYCTDHMERKSHGGPPTLFTYYSAVTGPVEAAELNGLADGLPALESLLRIPSFWLDICNPSPSDMSSLAQIFSIHPLTVEDIETASTREKCETFRAYMFVCYCALDQNPESQTFMQSFNVYILVYQHFVLSFHYCPLPSVRKISRRLDALKSYLQLTPHWINYAYDEILYAFCLLQ